jgi:hypothetical protein
MMHGLEKIIIHFILINCFFLNDNIEQNEIFIYQININIREKNHTDTVFYAQALNNNVTDIGFVKHRL